MQRRDFLKNSCRICLLGSTGIAAIELMSCNPSAAKSVQGSAPAANNTSPDVINNQVTVPTNIFNTKPLQIISPKKYEFEIAVEKKEDGTYEALLLRCTHYDNQLTPTPTGYFCSLHGSKFDKEGQVLKGPAQQKLTALKTTVTNNNLLIQLS